MRTKASTEKGRRDHVVLVATLECDVSANKHMRKLCFDTAPTDFQVGCAARKQQQSARPPALVLHDLFFARNFLDFSRQPKRRYLFAATASGRDDRPAGRGSARPASPNSRDPAPERSCCICESSCWICLAWAHRGREGGAGPG